MKGRVWLLAWVLLLGASHLVRWTRPEPGVPGGMRSAEVADGLSPERAVRIAFRDSDPEAAASRPVVLLLHGSPGTSADFSTLAPPLAERYRVVAPDLPGFGASSRSVADLSIAAHAGYVLKLLDALDIERAHLIGFSMGGGVAIEIADLAPERARSLTLLSAIGVQELELLGSYPLNHAVHGLQLALLWACDNLLPHFGWFDDSMLSVAYARNFYDTDQRPLRGALSAFEAPALIVHGERDPLVPVAAAREHHRIVPQSELTLNPHDHFEVFRRGRLLAVPIVDFIDRVERGEVAVRADADPARLRAANEPFDPSVVPRARGITLLVFMFLLAAATLVSEDLTCVGAGLLVAQGRIGLLAAVVACMVGILVGDLLLFAAGRWLGRPWLGRVPLKWFVSAKRVDAASDWFRRRGAAVVLISRFMPGARLPTYVAAGVLHTPWLTFAAWFTVAVGIWTPLLVGVSALVGEAMLGVLERVERVGPVGFLAAAIVVWTIVGLARCAATWRGRRRLVGVWRRWTRWEYWPMWLFYPPVVLWVLWLGLRHRSPTLFTAANPAMPAGGFVGESKAAILDGLEAATVARYRAVPAGLPAERRAEMVDAFLADEGLSLPVVLKPDAGERGRGVRIIRMQEEIGAFFADTDETTLVQEFVDGPELGIFYVREPGTQRGSIFSITDKRLPAVVGDGDRTIERLILEHDRWVAMAPTFLDRLSGCLQEVPAVGERISLGDLGTHSRGALFLDGSKLATPALAAEVDRIARSQEGFYFGRFDFRAPTRDAFLDGRDLKVLELNGVTSEATHIYDPANSLLDAYRVLFRQWALAFEIGRANRARGAAVATVRQLLGDLVGAR